MSKVKIGDITTSCLGKMLDAAKNKGDFEPYLANINVRWGSFDLNDLQKMRFEAHEQERYEILDGDLIMCEGGEPGRCAVWRAEVPNMKIQKALHRIRANSGVNIEYLYYWFLLACKNHLIDGYFTGSTIKHLPGDKLNLIELDLPDENVQNKVVKVLSSLDAKIANNTAICAELEAMAKLIYDYWFVQFDFPDEHGRPYKSSGGAMVWNDALRREIPAGWTNGYLSDWGEIVGGGTPSTAIMNYYTNNGIAWATPKDLAESGKIFFTHGERDITQQGLDSSSAVLMPKGSVLMTSRAPIGYLAIARNEVCTNQGFKSVVPKSTFSPYYIYETLKLIMPYIKRYGVGSTFAEVSKEDLSKIIVMLPNNHVVQNFDRKVNAYFERIANLEEESKNLLSLRDFLLPLLMNGQVIVSD